MMTSKREEEANEKSGYDRMGDMKAFNEAKGSVKGLVDAGVVKLPRMFIHDQHQLHGFATAPATIPTIDLKGGRSAAVRQIGEACGSMGLFRVVNHGMEAAELEEVIRGMRAFHEQDERAKQQFYTTDMTKGVYFTSNNAMIQRTIPANWLDILGFNMAPHPPLPQDLPQICRDTAIKYSKQVMNLAHSLLELMSEALGVTPSYLNDINCAAKQTLHVNYHPECPEPELTLGNRIHTDSGCLTILLVDKMGGLQILNRDRWVDVPPLSGSLIVNIGDFLQLISNDKFKSVTHRVLANRQGPRTSVACFFSPDTRKNETFGPINELITEESPRIYKEISLAEYMRLKFIKGQKDYSSALPDLRL